MPFPSLPIGIFHLVIHDLSKADLLALRLSCKHLCDVIPNHPFQIIVVEGNLESFQRLKRLSEEHHSKHVERLIYSGLFLDGDFSVDPYCLRNLAGENQWQSRKRVQVDRSHENYHYRRYRQILQSQQLMQTGHADAACLTYCIQRLPNLREIEFCSGRHRSRQVRGELAAFETLAPKSWGYADLNAQETLVHPDSVSGEIFHAKQFKALLTAANTKPQIDAIRAFGVPLAAFGISIPKQEVFVAQHCWHLVLEIWRTTTNFDIRILCHFLHTAA